MLGVLDYCIIGLLFIMCLVSAYLRRNSEDKLNNRLSFCILILVAFLMTSYLSLFYLIENYDKYLIYFILVSIFLIAITIILTIYFFKRKKENKDDEK